MIKKTDVTYDDIRDDLIISYTSQKERLNSTNIESYNNYITDEVLCEGAFKNEVDAFLHVLAICISMGKLSLYDKYFFDDVSTMIAKYKDGYYDPYFDDGEDKMLIDADIATVEEYIERGL